MIHQFQVDGGGPRYFGLYPAIVTDLVDPDRLGRIEVQLPWLGEGQGAAVRAWAGAAPKLPKKSRHSSMPVWSGWRKARRWSTRPVPP